jgi:hypothetical protein
MLINNITIPDTGEHIFKINGKFEFFCMNNEEYVLSHILPAIESIHLDTYNLFYNIVESYKLENRSNGIIFKLIVCFYLYSNKSYVSSMPPAGPGKGVPPPSDPKLSLIKPKIEEKSPEAVPTPKPDAPAAVAPKAKTEATPKPDAPAAETKTETKIESQVAPAAVAPTAAVPTPASETKSKKENPSEVTKTSELSPPV